jgi:hypothetical protein
VLFLTSVASFADAPLTMQCRSVELLQAFQRCTNHGSRRGQKQLHWPLVPANIGAEFGQAMELCCSHNTAMRAVQSSRCTSEHDQHRQRLQEQPRKPWLLHRQVIRCTIRDSGLMIQQEDGAVSAGHISASDSLGRAVVLPCGAQAP